MSQALESAEQTFNIHQRQLRRWRKRLLFSMSGGFTSSANAAGWWFSDSGDQVLIPEGGDRKSAVPLLMVGTCDV